MKTPVKAEAALNNIYSKLDPNQIPTFLAATILEMESGKNGIDWHSLLSENRREQWPPEAIKNGLSKGNRSRYTYVPHYRKKGKIYYRIKDLRDWLVRNKLS